MHRNHNYQNKFQQHKKRKKFDNLIFGKQPVLELLKTDKTVDKILIQAGSESDAIFEIRKIASQKNIPLKYVPVEKLNTLTGGIHQGIIAFTSEIQFQKTADVLQYVIEQGSTPFFLLLDGITDVRNFGAIARTAYAAGVHALIIATNDAAPINEEAMKTSAGALHHLAVCREKNIVEIIRYLKLNGLQILGADAHANMFLDEADLKIPLCIVMGSEDEGIQNQIKNILDYSIKIPMNQQFDSYNVSVAAGMILYETMRQRKKL